MARAASIPNSDESRLIGVASRFSIPSRAYCAVMPPSILNSEPVTNLDSSEAR